MATANSKLTVVIPATHTKTNVEERPLPECGSEIILLVWIGDKGVVRSHHGNVEVDEILQERRLVVTRVARWEPFVGVALNVPVGVDVTGVVLLDAGRLNLLETPLRQVDVAGSEVAAKVLVSETERRGKSSKSGVVPRSGIADDLDNPVIFGIADCNIAIAGNLVVSLGDRGSYLVGVQVATSLRVDKTDDIVVAGESQLLLSVVWDLVTVGVEEPVVVGVLVVVASDLLLVRAFGVGLDVGMKQTSSVTHVLQRSAGAVCDLEGAVLADFGAAEVGLEERAHLSITRTTVLEDQEVEVEGESVDSERNEDETEDAESEVSKEFHLYALVPLSLSSGAY